MDLAPDYIPPEVGLPIALVLCVVWLAIEWADSRKAKK